MFCRRVAARKAARSPETPRGGSGGRAMALNAVAGRRAMERCIGDGIRLGETPRRRGSIVDPK